MREPTITFEVWSSAFRDRGFSFKCGGMTLESARSLCAQLARDGMTYELISTKDRSLVETNASCQKPSGQTSSPSKGKQTMLTLHADSHRDHNLTDDHIAFILERFKYKTGAFIETVKLPDDLPGLPCALHGPIMGDEPIPSAHVVNWKRGTRSWTSRLCGRAPRLSRLVTVIGGPHDGHACVMFTAYGGPLAPREPDDPSIAASDTIEREESIAFWSEHALSLPDRVALTVKIETTAEGALRLAHVLTLDEIQAMAVLSVEETKEGK